MRFVAGMIEVVVTGAFESWQQAARDLVQRGVPPEEVRWVQGPAANEQDDRQRPAGEGPTVVVPRRFVELAQSAAAHPSAGRWATMYRVLWRLVRENRRLLERSDDPDVRALSALQPSEPEVFGHEFQLLPQVSPSAARRQPSAPLLVPSAADLGELASAAASCTACELYKRATQVVFGRGPANAQLLLVGEQPGDQEDLQGAPFVGPAGEVLDRALADVGLDRQSVYVTNAVKHFKFETRGKRRIHQTPRASEIAACRPWLEAELAAIKPDVLVCLGATAAKVIFGDQFRITR